MAEADDEIDFIAEVKKRLSRSCGYSKVAEALQSCGSGQPPNATQLSTFVR